MKMLSITLTACLSLFLVACDAKDNVNRPKTETRTMIIGGVPAYDKDYQTVDAQKIESTAVVKK
jgi:hypothetical protein